MNPKNSLEPANMINLYARGAFPMADETGKINWFFPNVRTIISLNNFNIPRSLKVFLRKSDFTFAFDKETMTVVRHCAARKETWISNELINSYANLKKIGFLHSVSVYQSQKLVGGLYGVTYRGAFFGESMFSTVSQASKCALVKLIERLNKKQFVLLDVQYETDHLKMFGAKEIKLETFEKLLLTAYKNNVRF